MRRKIAEMLNTWGNQSLDDGRLSVAERFYRMASIIDSRWSVPWYNRGLQAKNMGRWEQSFQHNARAVQLNPEDEAGWWNLGIAATALRDWAEARRAWTACGVLLDDSPGEVRMPAVMACVRLNPESTGEVVWGQRLDPARTAILSVPLPESGHRFHDIVLNDGASNGTRRDQNGSEVPVFDELSIWQVSRYSTFCGRIRKPESDAALEHLVALCEERRVGLEDWSTIRFVCAECSRGNPGPHDCKSKRTEDGATRFGFGARAREDLVSVLEEWASANAGAEFGEIELLVPAGPM